MTRDPVVRPPEIVAASITSAALVANVGTAVIETSGYAVTTAGSPYHTAVATPESPTAAPGAPRAVNTASITQRTPFA